MLYRVIVVALVLVLAPALVGSALADDPHPAPPAGSGGQPSQTCGPSGPPPGGGNSAGSPGSPFYGGNADSHYSPGSQYDVACFQQGQHTPHP